MFDCNVVARLTMTNYLYLLQPFIYSLVQVSRLVRTCSEWHTTNLTFEMIFSNKQNSLTFLFFRFFWFLHLTGHHSKSFTLKRFVRKRAHLNLDPLKKPSRYRWKRNMCHSSSGERAIFKNRVSNAPCCWYLLDRGHINGWELIFLFLW